MKKHIKAILALALIGSTISFSAEQVKASDGSDIVREAKKFINKGNYSFAPSNRKTKKAKSIPKLVKKYHLKKYTIPKKFRGKWYNHKNYAIITAKHFYTTKGMNSKEKGLPIYKGNSKINQKILQKYGVQTNFLLAWPYRKHSLTLTFPGSQPFGITRLTNYGHAGLMIESPHSVFYRSKKLSYKLSPSVQHEIKF